LNGWKERKSKRKRRGKRRQSSLKKVEKRILRNRVSKKKRRKKNHQPHNLENKPTYKFKSLFPNPKIQPSKKLRRP
jgi:hypothetical protein